MFLLEIFLLFIMFKSSYGKFYLVPLTGLYCICDKRKINLQIALNSIKKEDYLQTYLALL